MRKIVVSEFPTLDGVMQAPGDPNEDRSGGFEHGGWQRQRRGDDDLSGNDGGSIGRGNLTMAGETIRFRSVVEQARGAGAAVALVPPDATAVLGGLKQMRVIGMLNGVEFGSSTFPWHGEELYVGLPKATRAAAGVEVGDEVDIELTRDDSPRVLELAPDLEKALAADPELRARFDRLSFSRRREIADPVAEAKKPETRAARVDRALERLRRL